jgi:hypothetical protein
MLFEGVFGTGGSSRGRLAAEDAWVSAVEVLVRSGLVGDRMSPGPGAGSGGG